MVSKGVDKAKETANEGKRRRTKGEHCKDNYSTISNFQHFKSTFISETV